MLFISKTLVKFKLVEDGSVESWIHKPIVLVAFLILLPLKVDEGVSRILFFYPYCSGFQDSSDEIFVIALTQIKLSP